MVQSRFPKFHRHLPGLGGVKKQVVGVAPCDKVLDQFPVLSIGLQLFFLSIPGATHGIIRVFLHMAEL